VTTTPPAHATPLTADERRALLALARASVIAQVQGGPAPRPARRGGRLEQPGAAFVSLHCGTQLRGCLGSVEAHDETLSAAVVRLSAAAAAEDPRFPPLTPDELLSVSIEISVLGPLVPIAGPADLVIGRDGLVVDGGGLRGLLLPQVAVRYGWDPDVFLRETYRKAGLAPGAWREDVRLFRFEAEVFSEGDADTATRSVS
jgi:AmmeMemoRadiSam system protein A